MGQSDSARCHNNLAAIQQTYQNLGIPLALENLQDPSHSRTFLGLTLGLKRKITKREILSLVRSLQHASKVVRPGRIFTARMCSTAARVKEFHHFIRYFSQTCNVGILSSIFGKASVSHVLPSINPTLIIRFRLMYQARGDVELIFQASGFSSLDQQSDQQ